MPNKINAVSNSGPLIHLLEIKSLNCLKIFQKILIPKSVLSETERITKTKFAYKLGISPMDLSQNSLAKAFEISQRYAIDLAEAEAIALALQEKINLFFTDDLDARVAAKELNLVPVGTLGIILRAYRVGILKKPETIVKIKMLQEESTLFLTSKLVKQILAAFENDKEKA